MSAPSTANANKSNEETVVVDLDDDETETSETKNTEKTSKPDENQEKGTDIVEIMDDAPDVTEVIDLVHEITGNTKCINYACKSGTDMIRPPEFCLSYYRVKNKENKKFEICQECYDIALEYYDKMAKVLDEGESLINLEVPFRNDMVEIDDSDSDEEETVKNETLSDFDMKFLEEHLDQMVLDSLEKYKFDEQKDSVLSSLKSRTSSVADNVKEITTVLKNIQKDLDAMCIGIYSQFKVQHQQLPAIEVLDGKIPQTTVIKTIQPSATTINSMAVRNNRQVNQQQAKQTQQQRMQKGLNQASPQKPNLSGVNPDIVSLAAKLPPRGPIIKEPPKIGQFYYIARNMPFGSWVRGNLIEIFHPGSFHNGNTYKEFMYYFTVQKSAMTARKAVNGKELAYATPASVMLDVGTRVIAAFREVRQAWSPVKSKRDQFYPGIVAEPLAAYNKYRYLIFFDDGYAQYVLPELVHLIYDAAKNIWEDINEGSRPFIKKYLEGYPERPMVKLQKDQQVQTEYNGKWLMATVKEIDCSLVQMSFESTNRIEWIYRGSTRLSPLFQEEQAATNRLKNHLRPQKKIVQPGAAPYVQYTRSEGESGQVQQRSVARKSTAKPTAIVTNALPPNHFIGQNEAPPSKIVYYTPRKQKPNVDLYKPHSCTSKCKEMMLSSLEKLVGYAPLAKPLLCGFNRLMVKYKNKKVVMYKSPCGRTLRNMQELHMYLRTTKSNLTVDLFDFDYWVRCLAEFMLEPKVPYVKDMSNGVEEVCIQMVNYVDNTKQDFTQYSKQRMPLEGVNLNLDPEFLVGCDCEDDCMDRNKCSCWQLTLAGKQYFGKDQDVNSVGYNYRRLPESIATGIYECNSRCKCASTCLNRVVQNPLQHKLQVFKTHNRGWGIRCLNDIPQGAFVCIYAGVLLTDEMANQSGKCYGDEYYAELDYIECAERWKEDYEADVIEPEDYKDNRSQLDSLLDDDSEQSEIEEITTTGEDRDFIPSFPFRGLETTNAGTNMRTRLRKRANEDGSSDNSGSEKKVKNFGGEKKDDGDDTVMISDDEEENRETLSFNPKQEPEEDNSDKKFKSVRDIYGENEAVYIMDAKTTGNIGRFLNHSCSPNIFVQNVFVDTHDVRFPWVAFFAMNYIRAGTELTWNYNYDIGSVPGKILYCYCNSTECKGRLL